MNFNDVAIVPIKGNNYRVHFWHMRKDEAISIMHNSSLNEKTGLLELMSGTTYYQRNREVILNRAKDYYKNNSELLRERAKNKYRELSEEEKYIKREYGKKQIS